LKNPATAKEAITAAKLDYEIELQPIFLKNGKQLDAKASVRKDTQNALGIVSEKYKIIQNVEAFDFFDNVVGDKKAIYHTAGALGLGERIWILAKLPKNLIIKKEEIEKYLLLTNSHDGKSALKMYFTPIRVVCQNTLILSLMNASSGISIRHMGDINNKIDEAQRALGIATMFYSDFEKIAEKFTEVKMDVKKAESYFTKVLDVKKEEDISTRADNQRHELLSLFERGKGNDNPLIKHTLWAAYNAVTEYSDHCRTIKNLDKDKSLRLDNIWFGSGANFKERGYEVGLEFAGISKN
jgi:phage/plasmid-like protein (TIGR03299 family)